MRLIYDERLSMDMIHDFGDPEALVRWVVGYDNTRRAQSLGLEYQHHFGLPDFVRQDCQLRIWLVGPERAQTLWLIGYTGQRYPAKDN